MIINEFKIFDLEQRNMPEAVGDSHKSEVERNVLSRLLTWTFIYFCKEFQMTLYLRGEVRLPGNLFLTAKPRVSTGASGECKSRLLKNIRERSSSSPR